MTTPFACPECGGRLELLEACEISKEYAPGYHVAGRALPRRIEVRPAALCTECEFAIEVRPGGKK